MPDLPEIELNIETVEIVATENKLKDWRYFGNARGGGVLEKINLEFEVKSKNIRSIEDDWEVSRID